MIAVDSGDQLAEIALAPWQRHNARLGTASVVSIVAAMIVWIVAASSDGRDPLATRDPWYAAIAIEFFIWGVIDLLFAIGGFRGVAQLRSIDAGARRAAAVTKAIELARLLRMNRWLNVVWITTGVALLAWGYFTWSASLVGHGVGVLVQAIVLTILDAIFASQVQTALSTTRQSEGLASRS